MGRSPASTQAPAAPARPPEKDFEDARALERALSREQGMVLAPRIWEIEPSLQIQHNSNRGLRIVQTTTGPQVAEAQQQFTRAELGLGLRVGLPHDFQVGLILPYVTFRNLDEVASLDSSAVTSQSAWGDPEIRLTRQLSAQKSRRPAVLGYAAWRPAIGDYRLGAPSPGTGFTSSSAGFTLVQRDDPLVYVAALRYTHYRTRTVEGQIIQPGRNLGVTLTTLLATSPEGSLRWGLDLSHAVATRSQGQKVLGTPNLSAVMEFGVSRLVSSKTLLDVSLGVGLTSNAPDFRLSVAMPFSFP